MKAADLAVIVFFALLAAGGAGAFFYWKAERAREDAQRYEAALDYLVDRKISAVRLDWLAGELEPHGEGKLEALRAMYEDRPRSDRLNLGFGTLRGDWRASYEAFAEQAGREPDDGALRAEVDERYGAGAYALMEAQYNAFLDDAPRRQMEEDARRRAECLAQARAMRVRLTCSGVDGIYTVDGTR